jgi:uncharacterized membrane protein
MVSGPIGRIKVEWKEIVAILITIILVVAFSMETYKKTLRGDGSGKTKASQKEIILVASLLSVALTVSFAFGLGFPGLPLAVVGYILVVFLLQWQLDQNVVKQLWKVPGILGKAWLRGRGVSEKDVEDIEDAG